MSQPVNLLDEINNLSLKNENKQTKLHYIFWT